ncbi:Exoribonuclease II [Terriglobus saanensis SP1PR4]|uniref:Exoribonuclease II n=2 Tax=Terriglobus saanensis TaxID=870903 RepID=E8UXD0_TERSS|nr:Exoribonuclease II [Terriglobus saanensis SP1PR4]
MSGNHFDLNVAAAGEMQFQGFSLRHSADEQAQLATIVANDGVPQTDLDALLDLRNLLWSSIDNDTSRDLDQIEWAEETVDPVDPKDAAIRVLIGVADVSAAIAKDSPIDRFARDQTQTVYTGVRNFPMLPNALSTGLTSLNENEDRAALIIEYTVLKDGAMIHQKIYRAQVQNKAQLAYSSVGPFLSDNKIDARLSIKLAANPELQQQLRLQDEAAQNLRAARARNGSLDFRRSEAQPILADGVVKSIESIEHNRAMQLIEDLMIASNETVAESLHNAKRSSLRRIVRSPERWQRIVDLAALKGTQLPAEPDSLALNGFILEQQKADPDHYPDLALTIIKLMGAGEYVLSRGNDPTPPAHFALAAQDYSHSTAPNRRFPDLVTQRLVKAMLAHEPAPYGDDELAMIAEHTNDRERATNKVARSMFKRITAVAMQNRVGETFNGVITGANDKGVWVRVFTPPVEGKIVQGDKGLDVGDKVRVKLIHTDPQRAFIDFARV